MTTSFENFANFYDSQVFASDISASLIKIAQGKTNSNSENQNLENYSNFSVINSEKNSKNLINYFVCDGANFDNFEEKDFGTFDLIYANMSLHYIQNLVEFKRGILKLLKSGGKFVFTTSHPFSDLKLFSEKPKNQLTRAEMSQIASNYLKNQTVQTFFGDFPLIIHKRSISFYVNFFLGEFKLEKMREISKIQPKEKSEKFLKNGEFNPNSENQIFDTGIPAYFGLSFVKL